VATLRVPIRVDDPELGAFYRRKKAHIGPAKAVTATAHKIVRIYYHLMKTGEEYVDGERKPMTRNTRNEY
jgi:hypothetical protein